MLTDVSVIILDALSKHSAIEFIIANNNNNVIISFLSREEYQFSYIPHCTLKTKNKMTPDIHITYMYIHTHIYIYTASYHFKIHKYAYVHQTNLSFVTVYSRIDAVKKIQMSLASYFCKLFRTYILYTHTHTHTRTRTRIHA